LYNRFFLNLSQTTVIYVSAGHRHSAIVLADGRLLTFGSGDSGRLGHGDCSSHRRPEPVAALEEETIGMVACGGSHTVRERERDHTCVI